MSLPHNEHQLGKPLRNKRKRSAVFIVIVVSIAVHVLGGGVLAVIKIAEAITEKEDFVAPPIEPVETPPPPPPPPPTAKRTQRSMPRPQPLAAQNPQSLDVPAIKINSADLNMVTGRGLGGGLGEIGGGTMDSINITAFGFDQFLEGTLTATLYDFKTDPSGKPIKRDLGNFDNPREWGNIITKFAPTIREFSRNFNVSKLDRTYYKADKKLYASYFVIPWGKATIAPKSFGVEGEIKPTLIGAHYKGTFKPTKSGRFRFFGRADDTLLVRINNRLVLDGSVVGKYSDWRQSTSARKHDEDQGKPTYFRLSKNFYGMTGDWFTLREGQETEMEVFIAEVPGGDFGAYLLIEEEGVPGLKIFSSRPLSDQDKQFLRTLHPDAAKFL